MYKHLLTIVQHKWHRDYFASDYTIEITDPENDFYVVFGVFDVNGQPKSDPDYVRWEATLKINFSNGTSSSEEVRVHKCTGDDFEYQNPLLSNIKG